MDLNIDKIESEIYKILNNTHNSPEKKKIKRRLSGNRPLIEMACPICGDSEKIIQKKRGNLYLNNMFYVCFNCGTRMSYIDLLNKFGSDVDIEEKIEIYKHIDKNAVFQSKNNEYDLSPLEKILSLEKTLGLYNERKDELFDIKPVEKNSAVYQYLKFNRYIDNFDNIFEGIYKITDKWLEPVMIILNRNGDNLLGFQIRNLKNDKKKRLYKIYDFQSIYNYTNDDKMDEYESLIYNKISHYYNILNVDFYNKINVFEGYLDSVFIPNSIGTTGVETDYDFLLKNDEIDIRFIYDNDKIGRNKTLQFINNGYSVFLWDKLFKDISKNDNKKLFFLRNNIKDLNDLVKLYKSSDLYNKLNLENYFSIDEFDKIYIIK